MQYNPLSNRDAGARIKQCKKIRLLLFRGINALFAVDVKCSEVLVKCAVFAHKSPFHPGAFLIMFVLQTMRTQLQFLHLIQVHFCHLVTMTVVMVSIANFANSLFHMFCGRSSCVSVSLWVLDSVFVLPSWFLWFHALLKISA